MFEQVIMYIRIWGNLRLTNRKTVIWRAYYVPNSYNLFNNILYNLIFTIHLMIDRF